jgi:hypothetical protein
MFEMLKESCQRLQENNKKLLEDLKRKDEELVDQRQVWEQQLVDVRRAIGNIKGKPRYM